MEYKTCTHVHDNGNFCQSPALTGRDYCCFHLRHRGRLMRMAKYRARNERFDLNLPPLENMHAVQSALSQLVEAVAANMIDLKRAHFLLSALRQAANHFKHPDAWQTSAYHNDQSQPHPDKYDNFEAEYGLPEDLDLNLSPEAAFPSPPAPAASATDNRPLATDNLPDPSPMPTAGYCSEHGYDCPDLIIRADHPVTPEMIEVNEISEARGSDAAARRGNQLERNRQRRFLNKDRKRYAAIALEKNMRLAAEKLAERKLAAQKAAADSSTKKPPASIDEVSLEAAQQQKEAQSIA